MPNLDPITGFPIPNDYGNDGLDKFVAGMALANPISGWSDRRFAPNYKADVPEDRVVGYDPWADPRIKKYDPMHFVDSQSEGETTNMIASIERNMALQKRATGIPSIAGTVTGVFGNPFIMVPAIATGGASIPTMMAAEAGGEILSEMLLHSQQPLRTKTETALNIGLATGAAGLGGFISKKLDTSAQREVADTAHGGDGMYAHPIPEEARTGYDAASREFVETPEAVPAGTPIYHGRADELTLESRNVEETGIHFSEEPAVAYDVAIKGGETLERKGYIEGGIIHKTDVDPEKYLKLDELSPELEMLLEKEKIAGGLWSPPAVGVRLEQAGIIDDASKIKTAGDVWDALKKEGYEGIRYSSDEYGESYILPEVPKSMKVSDRVTHETDITGDIGKELFPDVLVLEKRVTKAEDIVIKATERLSVARAKLIEAGC